MAMATHDVTDTNVMADINVTPMVDVMLVLLIIFMVVTPALMAGFNAKLPDATHLITRPDKEDRTQLGIDRAGAYYLNKKPVAGCTAAQRQTPAGRASCNQTMVQLLQQEYQKHPEDHVLFLKADQSLKFSEVEQAMALGKQGGARVVAAVTEQTPGTKADEEKGN